VEFKQSNIGEIIESERLMVLSAPERFGHFYDNAMGTNYLLQHGVAGVPHHRGLFARWASQLKKYHLLALWSFVRLHQIQGLMNLRQVLEAAVDAAFAVAHPDNIEDYAREDKRGALVTAKSLKTRGTPGWRRITKRGRIALKRSRTPSTSTAPMGRWCRRCIISGCSLKGPSRSSARRFLMPKTTTM
jgi:hypothetical protein